MLDYLSGYSRDSFFKLMTLSLLVVVAAAVSYVIWPQSKTYFSAVADYKSLQSVLSGEQNHEAEIAIAMANVRRLRQELHGDMANLPEQQLEAHIMGQLQELSWLHNIELSGVRPRPGRKIDRFNEVLFEVNLSGGYFDIFNMLIDMDQRLGFVVIENFRINPQAGKGQQQYLSVSMTVATYQVRR
jgi:Tfp pilus assembly protein PilO